MVLFRPLRLVQRLDEPLSVLVHKVCLCSKIDRGSPRLCSSLRGLSSTTQLRIDSSQPAQACPGKFHNAAHTTVAVSDDSTMPTIFPHIRPADIILLKQPTGQRQSNVRVQQKEKLIGPILFLYYEESLVSSNLNSNQVRFHGAHPNLFGK